MSASYQDSIGWLLGC